MSTSTQDKTPGTSPPINKDKQALEKKKLKVLKMALKEERSSKATIELELKAAYDKIEQLKQQISDKETKYLSLYNENINLQEALVRESKGDKKPKASTQAKPPLLGAALSFKKEDKGALDQQAKEAEKVSEAYEMLKVKCQSQEELLMRKEDELKELQKKVSMFDSEMHRIQNIFDEKINEIINERDLIHTALKSKETEFETFKKEMNEKLEKSQSEMSSRIQQLENEAHELREQKHAEMDKNLKIEETIDEKNEKIVQLEKELLRTRDEVNLRKEVIDSMSQSLLNHEKESRELASKLVLMKNQILENDIGKMTDRKYAAVKTNGKSPLPCTVSYSIQYCEQLNFIREKNEHYVIIDSNQFEMQINFESVEVIQQQKDGKLNIIYYIPNDDGSGFKKISDTFECFEVDDILQIYNTIRNQIETNELKGMRVSQSFMGPGQFAKSKTQGGKKGKLPSLI